MKNRENILDKINNGIPDSVRDLLEVAANLFTILAPVGGGLVLLFSWIKGTSLPEDIWKNYVIFVLALVMIFLFYRFVKQKADHRQDMKRVNAQFNTELLKAAELHQKERSVVSQKYYQLMHDYRNVINELEHSYKNGRLTERELTVMVVKFLEDALDYLVETLNNMTGQKVSACVKAIIGGNCKRISYEDAKVKTFVRSKNTDPARRSLDQQDEQGILIRENTDFMYIVAEDRSKGDSVFYQPDLKEYKKQLRAVGKDYLNSTPHWEKYYIGTIVAPIRIASKRLFYLDKGKSKKKNRKSVYYTLGFLCVDSLSENAFTWEQKDNYTYIVKSYAAAMFNILSKNQFYLTRIQENRNR